LLKLQFVGGSVVGEVLVVVEGQVVVESGAQAVWPSGCGCGDGEGAALLESVLFSACDEGLVSDEAGFCAEFEVLLFSVVDWLGKGKYTGVRLGTKNEPLFSDAELFFAVSAWLLFVELPPELK
jgi:hypothetical protein